MGGNGCAGDLPIEGVTEINAYQVTRSKELASGFPETALMCENSNAGQAHTLNF